MVITFLVTCVLTKLYKRCFFRLLSDYSTCTMFEHVGVKVSVVIVCISVVYILHNLRIPIVSHLGNCWNAQLI